MLDYIIVGWGIAGLNLANKLEKEGKSFIVIDKGTKNATKVAGGITNPLILKRFTKAWEADTFIPIADKTYKELDAKLQIHSFTKKSIFRKIKTSGEQNDWLIASDKKELSPFMNGQLQQISRLPNPFKYGEVLQASLLDTEKLLTAYQAELLKKNSFRKEAFEYNLLDIKEEALYYKDLAAEKIIFCEGYGLLKNPFFNYLPLVPNKGEYIILRAPNLKLKHIVKTAIVLIPLGNDLYKFGATYSREFADLKPEKEAEEFLIKKLEELIDGPYSIIEKQTGVRPTVKDRRPLLGSHPKHPELLVCNGFGSHGIMIAPTMTEWLVNFDLYGKELPKQVNIKRHQQLFEQH